MPIGMIGTKIGMTRVFTDQGVSVPVTVIHAPANQLVQVKTLENDGYQALQLSGGKTRRSLTHSKAVSNHHKKAGVQGARSLREFRIRNQESAAAPGAEFRVGLFQNGEFVDVIGVSKGKGTAGTVKRYNFRMQDATHGNSVSHRAPGSTGQCQFPGRVFKGKKMAGRMGSARVTAKNLEVVQVDEERELILVKGSVPGSRGGDVLIQHCKTTSPQMLFERQQAMFSEAQSKTVASSSEPAATEATTSKEPEATATHAETTSSDTDAKVNHE